MAWFDFLLTQDAFHPSKNPHPVKVKEGVSIPHWEALTYLERLSEKFIQGQELEYVPKVLEIITNISTHPVDNYSTWRRLVIILSNIPNDRVPLSMLDYIPVWSSSRYDNTVVAHAIIDRLLPKFSIKDGSEADRKKFVTILKYLFQLRWRDESSSDGYSEVNHYYSPYDLYLMSTRLIKEPVVSEIANILDNYDSWFIPDTINYLLRDRLLQIEINQNFTNLQVSLLPQFDDLTIKLAKKKQNEVEESVSLVFENYFDRISEVEDFLWKNVLDFEPFNIDLWEEELKKIKFFLEQDVQSHIGYSPISDLQDNIFGSGAVLNAFTLTFRDALCQLAIQLPAQAATVLNGLRNKERYDLPYFKRLMFHVIAQNWPSLKHVFWEMAEGEEGVRLFSTHVFKVELYELLKKICSQITEGDVKKLKAIIEIGPIGDKHYESNRESWALRWYDALQNHQEFKHEYQQLTTGLAKVINYSEEGRIKVRIGNMSPFATDELFKMDLTTLAETMRTFKNVDEWDGPTIEGLGDTVRDAVAKMPERFSAEMAVFEKISSYYAYEICLGFDQAKREGKDFEWQPVLRFYRSYITLPELINGEKQKQQGPRLRSELLYGAIGRLISEATKGDKYGLSENDLNTCKEIVLLMITRLGPSDMSRHEKIEMDYVMYSLNSSQGQVLRALIDVSLHEGRKQTKSGVPVEWNSGLQRAFTKSMEEGIIDGFTLIGMYLPQFMFLNQPWLKDQIVKIQTADDRQWAAFMGGIAFGKPVSIDYYAFMKPHYEKAISTGIIDTTYQSGLIRHFLAYYFWDFDGVFEQGFLFRSIQLGDIRILEQLINIVNQQLASINDTDDSVADQNLIKKIIKIWRLILDGCNKVVDESPSNKLSSIIMFIDFITPDQLNPETENLIIKTMAFCDDVSHYHVLERLSKLATCQASGPIIAKVLASMSFSWFDNKEDLNNLIRFLYENDQKMEANNIVNKMSLKGIDFLRETYLQYNNP